VLRLYAEDPRGYIVFSTLAGRVYESVENYCYHTGRFPNGQMGGPVEDKSGSRTVRPSGKIVRPQSPTSIRQCRLCVPRSICQSIIAGRDPVVGHADGSGLGLGKKNILVSCYPMTSRRSVPGTSRTGVG
jgi:hypothetical protein